MMSAIVGYRAGLKKMTVRELWPHVVRKSTWMMDIHGSKYLIKKNSISFSVNCIPLYVVFYSEVLLFTTIVSLLFNRDRINIISVHCSLKYHIWLGSRTWYLSVGSTSENIRYSNPILHPKTDVYYMHNNNNIGYCFTREKKCYYHHPGKLPVHLTPL